MYFQGRDFGLERAINVYRIEICIALELFIQTLSCLASRCRC